MPRISTQELLKNSKTSTQVLCSIDQKTHSQFLLAHQRVNKKNTASTREAILLAFVLNPHAIRHAPMKDDPR
jgi:hypothetical protein